MLLKKNTAQTVGESSFCSTMVAHLVSVSYKSTLDCGFIVHMKQLFVNRKNVPEPSAGRILDVVTIAWLFLRTFCIKYTALCCRPVNSDFEDAIGLSAFVDFFRSTDCGNMSVFEQDQLIAAGEG